MNQSALDNASLALLLDLDGTITEFPCAPDAPTRARAINAAIGCTRAEPFRLTTAITMWITVEPEDRATGNQSATALARLHGQDHTPCGRVVLTGAAQSEDWGLSRIQADILRRLLDEAAEMYPQ